MNVPGKDAVIGLIGLAALGCGAQMRNPNVTQPVEMTDGMNALVCEDLVRQARKKLGVVNDGLSTTKAFPGRSGKVTEVGVSCGCGAPKILDEATIARDARELAAIAGLNIDKAVYAELLGRNDGLPIDDFHPETARGFCMMVGGPIEE